ncbi:MAG: hypothetical protein M1827_007494 [Pycnora praestabilis]|nr:MAG: hypothetical protein M1827_007494 [Pycnora praestabilis]
MEGFLHAMNHRRASSTLQRSTSAVSHGESFQTLGSVPEEFYTPTETSNHHFSHTTYDDTPKPLRIVKRASISASATEDLFHRASVATHLPRNRRASLSSAPISTPRRRSSLAFTKRSTMGYLSMDSRAFDLEADDVDLRSTFSASTTSSTPTAEFQPRALAIRKRNEDHGESLMPSNDNLSGTGEREIHGDYGIAYPIDDKFETVQVHKVSNHAYQMYDPDLGLDATLEVPVKYRVPMTHPEVNEDDTPRAGRLARTALPHGRSAVAKDIESPTKNADAPISSTLESLTSGEPSIAGTGASQSYPSSSPSKDALPLRAYNNGLSIAHQFDALLSRQPSLKKRVLDRLLNNSSSEPEHTEGSLARRLSLKLRGNKSISGSTKLSDVELSPVSDHNEISTVKSTYDSTLAAFPAPPRPELHDSALNSPVGAESVCSWESLSPRVTASPEDANIVGVELKITPEYESIDIHARQNIWVTVEVEAVIQNSDDPFQPLTPDSDLNVAIVVDDSAFASPATFLAACELVINITSLLNSTDQLAVLSLNHKYSAPPGIAHVLSSLQPANLSAVKALVEGMKSRTRTGASPEDTPIGKAVEAAVDLLLKSRKVEITQQGKFTRPGDVHKKLFCHVFVISPNYHISSEHFVPNEKLTSYRKVQVHLVHPGLLPWRADHGYPNGWVLRSSSSIYPSKPSSTAVSRNEDGLLQRLRELISNARRGTLPGELTEVMVKITSTSNCSMVGVMGYTKKDLMRPGERMTAFVKLAIGPAFPDKPPTSSLRPVSEMTWGSEILLNRLDSMLGEYTTDILTVELTWKHTLVRPIDTVLRTIGTGQLKRHNGNAALALSPSRSNGRDRDLFRAHVQKSLAYFISIIHQPREGIKRLTELFGSDLKKSVCLDYVRSIITELCYHAHLTEKFDLRLFVHDFDIGDEVSGRSEALRASKSFAAVSVISVAHTSWRHRKTTSTGTSYSSHTPPGTRTPATVRTPSGERTPSATNTPYSDRTASTIRTVGVPANSSALTVTKRGNSKASTESDDEARKIWLDIRKKSIGHGRNLSRSSTLDAVDEHMMEALAISAVKNKRSVGADTLQSFAVRGRVSSEERRDSGEQATPWL